MHLPDHVLSSEVSAATAIVSAVAVAAAIFAARKGERKPDIITISIVSAFIFAAQMLNFPIAGGTSGHFIGGGLAALLLGIPYGVLVMSSVITLQTIIFADGGVTALGANVLIMGITAPVLSGLMFRFGSKIKGIKVFGAWTSVVVSSFVCAILVAVSNNVNIFDFGYSMVTTHMLIGIGEAAITIGALKVLASAVTKTERNSRFPIYMGVMTLMVLAAPFASSLPDGLESAMMKFKLIHDKGQLFNAPIPDYVLGGAYFGEMGGVIGAAIAGIVLSAITAALMVKLVESKEKIK